MSMREFFTGFHREAVRLCGIRQEPLESWIKDAKGHDVPELVLNLLLMTEAFLQMLATGLGALILVSAATVVAWTNIKKMDFWFITVIGIIQTAKIVGFISEPTARFFVQFPATSVHMLISRRTRRGHDIGDVGLASLVPILFAAAPMAIGLACYELSGIGLSGASDNYGGSDTDPKRGNVKPALIAFYSLVLAQSLVLSTWGINSVSRSVATIRISREYFGIGNTNGIELMDRYITQTQDKCIEKGIFSTRNRTLVSFAAELLQSEHPSDHVSAVSVLHMLTTRKERAAGAVKQICSSEQAVGSLFKLLRPKSPLGLDAKLDTAEILTKLACNLRLTDISGAAHSISSLLDPHPCLMKTAKAGHPEPPAPGVTQTQTNNTNQGGAEPQPIRVANGDANGPDRGGAQPSSAQEIQNQTINTNEGGARDRPLIVLGLMILDKLASDPGNCTEICKTTDLMPKILAPLTHGLLNTLGNNDPKTIQIVKASLRVVAKLTSGTCESSSKLRRELILENGRTAGNIMWIMRNSGEQEMRILAVEILTRLTLGVTRMRDFIAYLKGLLFDAQHSPLRVSAGKALSALAVNHRNREVIWEQVGDDFLTSLVTAINDVGNSMELRAVMAEFLAQICAESRTNDNGMHDLSSISNSLSEVLNAIVITNIKDMAKRRFLASLLGFAVQIRENDLVTAPAFADAVRGFSTGNFCRFSAKLKAIIMEMSKEKESEDETCLVITKAAAKLIMWTISIGPVYAQNFQREDIVGKLQDVKKAMGDLERCVVLRGDTDEKKSYETLQTLVEKVRRNLVPLAPLQH